MALQSFIVTRAFNKLFARLHVDCWLKEASVTISYDRRIRRIEVVRFHEVATPELAEAWFGKSVSEEHGSWLEFHEYMCARDPLWLVNEPAARPPDLVVPKGTAVELPKTASHPDFYPPELGGKPENWPAETPAERNACSRHRKPSGVWACNECAVTWTSPPSVCDKRSSNAARCHPAGWS